MKKFIISEEEKKRILGLHVEATKKHYGVISEQPTPNTDLPITSLPKEFQDFAKKYNLKGTFNQTGQSTSSGEYGYNLGNKHTGFNTNEIKTYETYKNEYQNCLKLNSEWKQILSSGYTNVNNTQTKPGMPDTKLRPADIANKEQDMRNKKKEFYKGKEYCPVVTKMQGIISMK